MSFEADIAYLESLRAPEHPVVFYGSSSITMWHLLAGDLRSDRADAGRRWTAESRLLSR